jgi:hypothetical protein
VECPDHDGPIRLPRIQWLLGVCAGVLRHGVDAIEPDTARWASAPFTSADREGGRREGGSWRVAGFDARDRNYNPMEVLPPTAPGYCVPKVWSLVAGGAAIVRGFITNVEGLQSRYAQLSVSPLKQRAQLRKQPDIWV